MPGPLLTQQPAALRANPHSHPSMHAQLVKLKPQEIAPAAQTAIAGQVSRHGRLGERRVACHEQRMC